MAERRETVIMNNSETLFERAQKVIPGGVNSPVRAFKSVNANPIFIKSANGVTLTDEDGKTYTDYIGSWGPMILGHNNSQISKAITEALSHGTSYGLPTKSEVEMAELITEIVPSIEMVRMVSSGTEAVLSVLRLARGYTGKDMIVKFEGCYHGHSDSMLVKAGSGLATAGQPNSAGVTKETAADTITCRYNDLQSVKEVFAKYKDKIAAIIVEPVAANMGVIPPLPGFLQGLREITEENNALLIFDEVITGFRLSINCASTYFGIKPDLQTFGKIIGGGLPVGAYGGRKEIMQQISPLGPVYQAGTLSGNPIAMAAGITALKKLKEHPEIYSEINKNAKTLKTGLIEIFKENQIDAQVQGIESLITIFFTNEPVTSYDEAKKSDTQRYARWFKGLLENGIVVAPSQFEALFLSNLHTEKEIGQFLNVARKIVSSENF
ncbi:MAG: glutamate-1-semialdehyde 2,1-aminomutase [Synergistaceae bacterium]